MSNQIRIALDGIEITKSCDRIIFGSSLLLLFPLLEILFRRRKRFFAERTGLIILQLIPAIVTNFIVEKLVSENIFSAVYLLYIVGHCFIALSIFAALAPPKSFQFKTTACISVFISAGAAFFYSSFVHKFNPRLFVVGSTLMTVALILFASMFVPYLCKTSFHMYRGVQNEDDQVCITVCINFLLNLVLILALIWRHFERAFPADILIFQYGSFASVVISVISTTVICDSQHPKDSSSTSSHHSTKSSDYSMFELTVPLHALQCEFDLLSQNIRESAIAGRSYEIQCKRLDNVQRSIHESFRALEASGPNYNTENSSGSKFEAISFLSHPVGYFTRLARHKQLRVAVLIQFMHVQQRTTAVYVNKRLLLQVLDHILVKWVRAAQNGSSVTVLVRKGGEYKQVSKTAEPQLLSSDCKQDRFLLPFGFNLSSLLTRTRGSKNHSAERRRQRDEAEAGAEARHDDDDNSSRLRHSRDHNFMPLPPMGVDADGVALSSTASGTTTTAAAAAQAGSMISAGLPTGASSLHSSPARFSTTVGSPRVAPVISAVHRGLPSLSSSPPAAPTIGQILPVDADSSVEATGRPDLTSHWGKNLQTDEAAKARGFTRQNDIIIEVIGTFAADLGSLPNSSRSSSQSNSKRDLPDRELVPLGVSVLSSVSTTGLIGSHTGGDRHSSKQPAHPQPETQQRPVDPALASILDMREASEVLAPMGGRIVCGRGGTAKEVICRLVLPSYESSASMRSVERIEREVSSRLTAGNRHSARQSVSERSAVWNSMEAVLSAIPSAYSSQAGSVRASNRSGSSTHHSRLTSSQHSRMPGSFNTPPYNSGRTARSVMASFLTGLSSRRRRVDDVSGEVDILDPIASFANQAVRIVDAIDNDEDRSECSGHVGSNVHNGGNNSKNNSMGRSMGASSVDSFEPSLHRRRKGSSSSASHSYRSNQDGGGGSQSPSVSLHKRDVDAAPVQAEASDAEEDSEPVIVEHLTDSDDHDQDNHDIMDSWAENDLRRCIKKVRKTQSRVRLSGGNGDGDGDSDGSKFDEIDSDGDGAASFALAMIEADQPATDGADIPYAPLVRGLHAMSSGQVSSNRSSVSVIVVRALVVDDSVVCRKMVWSCCVNIARRDGVLAPDHLVKMELVDADDGSTALEIIQRTRLPPEDPLYVAPFDIIFMDNIMNKIHGPEATARIRRLGYKGQIMALITNITKRSSEIATLFRKNGADRVISRPINTLVLKNILRSIVKDKILDEALS